MTLQKKKCVFSLLFFGLCLFKSGVLYAQEPSWELAQPKYETADAFVIGINVMEHGADPTGTTDQTRLFQSLLDILGSRSNGRVNNEQGEKIGAQANRNGGTLYIPEGKYLLQGTLTIPKGVTIRGDWEKPVKGKPIKGTILMSANPAAKGNNCDSYTGGLTAYEVRALIVMQPSSAVRDVNIWYPDQDANNIVPYPPAILFGQQGYWGNDYCLASNITLVNAYDGIIFSRRAGGGAPNCYGIYGSPLKRGIEIDNIAEVGRIDNVDFSPDYWAGSGLPGSPSVNGPHKKFIQENATAVFMRRNDWSFACKVKAEGYKTGYHMALSYNPDPAGSTNYTSPNGHNYGMEFTDCKYGVYAEAVAGAGMMFYEYKFKNCDYGFFFAEKPGGVVQIQACEFDTKIASIYAPETNDSKILINQCTFNKGPVDIRGGLGSIVSSDFNDKDNHIVLGSKARVAITGNRFNGEPAIKNASMYECPIDHTPIEMDVIPHFPYKNQYDFNQKPAGKTYFQATANGVSTDADDNSDALQALLNQAGTDGGGLVFLPPGRYNFRKPITIPSGVELKGSGDVPCVPTGPGSVMEIYAGKDDENGVPFITMERGSGIRGLVMDYPEQKVQLLANNGDIHKYPYTIQGNADVYIVNIGFRASYRGIDLFTNKCDNHFVDYPAGHIFKTGIRVGGGSKGGHIYNAQFNQIAYGSGGETKFGAWPNSPDNEQSDQAKYSSEHTNAYAYCWNHLDFIVLEDCEEQMMYNNFDFGSNRGFVLSSNNGKGPEGLCLGQGIDQGMNAFYIAAVGNKGFSFINSQIVTTQGNDGVLSDYKSNNRYIQVDRAFDGKVTFFGADFWGQPQNISVDVLNGIVEMQTGNFSNSGQRTFASVSETGMFDIIGTNINNIGSLLTTNSAPQFYIQSSLVNKGSLDTATCGLWLNNLGFSASVSPDAGAFLDVDGWIASASIYNDDASKAIDRDQESRWSTLSERQKPGQWFMVDMRKRNTFNGIYLDAGMDTSKPLSITISISDDGVNWQNIVTGRINADQVLFEKQTAQYIKVTQNNSGTSAWRIAEFYVIDSSLPNTSIEKTSVENIDMWFSNNQLIINGTTGSSIVRLFNMAGQQVIAPFTMGSSTTADINLSRGIYLVVIENNGIIYRGKVMKNQ